MLPAVLTAKATKLALTGALAAALSLSAVAPAQALGKNERNFLKGVAAAMVVDRVLDDVRRNQKPCYYTQQPVYNYVAPAPVYRPAPQPTYRNSIYATPVAQAFNSYGYTDRKRIQQRLAAYGYYRSGIDGSFGPGTYNAIVAYANDSGNSRKLGSSAGVYGLFDGMIY